MLRILNELKFDPTLEWRIDYYQQLVNDCRIIPDIQIFNELWGALRRFVPIQFQLINWLLDEMDTFRIIPDDITVNEIINLCARYPTEQFQITADKFISYYFIFKEDIAQDTIWQPRVFHSFLKVWVNAGNFKRAYQTAQWIKDMDLWTTHMQHTYNKLMLPDILSVNDFEVTD